MDLLAQGVGYCIYQYASAHTHGGVAQALREVMRVVFGNGCEYKCSMWPPIGGVALLSLTFPL